jgi:hypothetical protein
MMTPKKLLPLVVLCLAHAAAPAGAATPVSQAEQMLFVDRHLGSVKPPSTLRYDFRQAGAAAPQDKEARDQVVLQLDAGADGLCCRALTRFAGGRDRPPLEIADARSNPVLMYFLEHDVREMQRLARGQPNYFRKRIRTALADDAKVTQVTVRYRGRDVPAHEVSIAPYANDPTRARYERYAEKRYAFVLAEGLPGGLAQIRTWVPAAQPGEAPVLQETLTLQEVTPP